MRGIRDDVGLPKEPPLEVVITGGSSAVEPMRTAVLDKVREALNDLGNSAGAKSLSAANLESVAPGIERFKLLTCSRFGCFRP